MKRFLLSILIPVCLPLLVAAQKDLKFGTVDSLFSYAEKNSAVMKTNSQQTLLAKYQKIAALANVINFRNPVSLALTENTQLPVTYVPAEFFGGPAGTFKGLAFGQKYASNFSITPQIDIINPGAWAEIRSANVNEELTSTNNLINEKSLDESIGACYYNIVSFQEQIGITQKNLLAADTLLMIINNKYEQGLVRQQDANDASINKVTLEDKLKQVQISLEQQYNSLKILCDIPAGTNLVVDAQLNYDQTFSADLKVNSQLQLRAAELQAESAKADLRFNRMSNLPVISLLYNNAYYQNSNKQFFDNDPNNKWLNSTYIGAKVTFFLPDVNRILLSRNSKISYHTALISLEHNKLQSEITNSQMELDYEKSYSQFMAAKQIAAMKEENYRMALNQYNASILPTDRLLTAFSDMLVSRYNYSSALASLLYTKTKIDINNKLK